MTTKRRTAKEKIELKLEAKRMLLQDGLTQREIAAKLGLNEGTIGDWARRYHWTDAQEALLDGSGYNNSLIDFLQFVKWKHPGLIGQLYELHIDFFRHTHLQSKTH